MIALSRAYPNLLSVDFTFSHITDSAIITLSNRCPYFHSVNICYGEDIIDENFIALSHGCQQLKSIYMSYANVTDRSITALSQGCPQLESIVLHGCEDVTGAGIEALAI